MAHRDTSSYGIPAPPNRPWSYCNSPHLASAWPIPSLKIPCHRIPLKKTQNGQNHLEFLEFYINWLVADLPLKNRKVNGKDDPICNGKQSKCLKPPTRDSFIIWRFPKTMLFSLASSKSWMTISLLKPVTWGSATLRNPRF